MKQPIGIIGAGAWGTALAQILALCEHEVLIWGNHAKVLSQINKEHINGRFLPGIALSERITAVPTLDELPQRCQTLFIVCPAAANGEIAAQIGPALTPQHTLVLCSKGLRQSDGLLMSDVWYETIGDFHNMSVLSGPSFAIEAVQQKPTAVTIAARDIAIARQVGDLFSQPWFRIYYSDDPVGVQVGGALKNVLAIAAGIIDGLELGYNCRAALLTRGLAEMTRYGMAIGAKPETFMGLSGAGDLILTASSNLSRNYRFGKLLAADYSCEEALKKVGHVVEGLYTARIITEQAIAQGIELAIIMAVNGIIHGDMSAQKAMDYLLMRPQVPETEERKQQAR